jgi:hypothetical protein
MINFIGLLPMSKGSDYLMVVMDWLMKYIYLILANTKMTAP